MHTYGNVHRQSVNGLDLVFRHNKNLSEEEIALFKDDNQIGYLSYTLSGDICLLGILKVQDDYKRKGHGSFLLQQLETLTKSKNIKKIYVSIGYTVEYESEEALTAFYTGNGYSVSNSAAEKILYE